MRPGRLRPKTWSNLEVALSCRGPCPSARSFVAEGLGCEVPGALVVHDS